MPRPKKPTRKHRGLHNPPDPVPDSLVDAIRGESHLALELLREFNLPVSVIPGMRLTMQAHVNPTRPN